MATISFPQFQPFASILVLIFLSIPLSLAEIRFSEIISDGRSIIPLDEFGFTSTGRLELNVSRISLSVPNPDLLALSQLGFFLSTRDSWLHVLDQIQEGDITCALQSNIVKLVYTFNQISANSHSFDTLFHEPDAGQFTLVFANCLPQLQISMDIRSAMYNLDPKTNRRDYLSDGSTVLPRVYFLFFLAYATLPGLWIYVLYKKRLTVFRIHFFMLAVLVLKALTLLCEAKYKSYISRTGCAHCWDVIFYIFSFLHEIMLFTVIVLIGTGWSFLKPYLESKEKKVLVIVILLRVVANIAQVAIDVGGPYSEEWITWNQVYLLADVICCSAVLFSIIWSIKNLRQAAYTDAKIAVNLKAAVNLMKLRLFRQYCIVVLCYIFFTRIAVFVLMTMTSYRYSWINVVAGELGNFALYVLTGYKFRPYSVIDDEEEEDAAVALKP